jgi:2-iminobutanoate/2-iminopropanoate deaminase
MLRRRSIEIHGFNHGGLPIPAASIVDNILFSGGVAGLDVESGILPDEASKQVENMFSNIGLIVKAAGGTTEDIVKITLYVRDRDIRDAINEEWLSMFPDEESRPARHIIVYDHLFPAMRVQAEFYAVLKS